MTSIAKSFLKPGGIDLFCFGRKFLVYNLVGRNLKIKYRRSFFGIFWTLLVPLAMSGVYYFVFRVILQIQVENFVAFIIGGILPWVFFSSTMSESVECLVISHGLLTKVPIPPQVFPFVGALTNFFTLLLSLPIILGAALLTGTSFGFWVLEVFFLLLCLFLQTYVLSLTIALAYVYFRDLKHIIGIILQLWFYGTPIIYQESMIPEALKWVLYVNPISFVFVGIHKAVLQGKCLSTEEFSVLMLWTFAILVFGVLFYRAFSKNAIEDL